MNKSTLGHFNIFDGINQSDLDSLQSFFGHHGNGHSQPPSSPQDAVHFRTIDGSNNNLADPTMNQTGTDFARVGPANFADGVSAMTSGPNPRDISNIVVAQANTGEDGPHLIDDNGVALSGMMYAWGQFVDHDLDLEKGGTTTDISITVPANDRVSAARQHHSLDARSHRSCDRCSWTSGNRNQHDHGLARWFTGIRIRRCHRGEPADSRRPYENVGRRQPAD